MWSYVRARLWEHKKYIKEYKKFAMAGENEDYFSGRGENVDVMGLAGGSEATGIDWERVQGGGEGIWLLQQGRRGRAAEARYVSSPKGSSRKCCKRVGSESRER